MTGLSHYRPLFHTRPSFSKSSSTAAPLSERGLLSQLNPVQMDNNESSDNNNDNWYLESAFYEKFDEQIFEYVEEVDRLIKSVAQERDILRTKVIPTICKDAFTDQDVRVDVFGSLANGLALESSDMDLVITGLEISNRDDIVHYIRILHQHFSNFDFFTSVKPIESATIPVIKLEADLEMVRKSENSSNTDEIDPKMRFLQIDITFEDSKEQKADSFWDGTDWHSSKVHLGMKSVHLVKSYIKEYVHLKELAL